MVFGFFSYALIADKFGATRLTDAYFAAMVIPRSFGDFLLGVIIAVVFLPVFVEYNTI